MEKYLLLKKKITNEIIEEKILRKYRSIILLRRPTNYYSENDNTEIIHIFNGNISQLTSNDLDMYANYLLQLSCAVTTINNIKMFRYIVAVLIRRKRVSLLIRTFRRMLGSEKTDKKYISIIRDYSNILSDYYAISGEIVLSASFSNFTNKHLAPIYDALLFSKKITIENIDINTNEELLNIISIYNNVVNEEKESEINKKMITYSDEYVTLINELQEEYFFENYRTIALFNFSIINSCALSNLYYASIENKKKDINVNSEIIEYIMSRSYNKTIKKMVSLMNSFDSINSLFFDFNHYYDTVKTADDIMNKLKLKQVDRTAIYYTKFDSLLFMLPQQNIEEDGQYNGKIGKFSLMHYAYMNDPTEGKMLKKQFGEEVIEDNDVKYPSAYLKCFTSRSDDIPMWEMYGDKAKGCCIFPDWNRMFDMYDDIPLYNVCYLDDKGKAYVYDSKNKKIMPNSDIDDLINKLKDYYEKIERDEDSVELFLNMLGEVMFLFKSIEYGYEEEIRLLFFGEESDIGYTNEKIPKIFVLTDFEVFIKKIIIGPKISDSSNIIPYLQDQLSKMNDIIGYDHETKIEKSKVHYK